MSKIQDILACAIQNSASDIRLKAGNIPWLRINGEWKYIPDIGPLSEEDFLDFYSKVGPKNSDGVPKPDLDFLVRSGYVEGGRFRANSFSSEGKPGLVLRSLPATIPPLAELGLPDAMIELLNKSKGLVLVTGATGSGKSTTMASIINHICHQPCKHIITLEDPIEYQLGTNTETVITQREIGEDSESFPIALRSAMREAPDVIMVGETRDDGQTASLLLTAAETGHLVFSTLHTASAAGTVERLTNMFPETSKEAVGARLSGNLLGILSQTLLPAKNGGRVMACEFLCVTEAVRSMIRRGESARLADEIVRGANAGMVTMERSINSLLAKDLITREVREDTLLRLGIQADQRTR